VYDARYETPDAAYDKREGESKGTERDRKKGREGERARASKRERERGGKSM